MEEKSIYSKIRDIRQAKGLSVNSLAEKIGEDHQKVGRIERGKRSLTIDYLLKVSKALETPVETFFTEERQKEDLDLLNEIVIHFEEAGISLDPKSKGKCISKLYELAAKFPKSEQRLFLESFFEGLKVFGASK